MEKKPSYMFCGDVYRDDKTRTGLWLTWLTIHLCIIVFCEFLLLSVDANMWKMKDDGNMNHSWREVLMDDWWFIYSMEGMEWTMSNDS